jgi:hypothetical protein
MVKIVVILAGIASLITACGTTPSSVTPSESETCERGGGVWRPVLGRCDRGGGAGGGGAATRQLAEQHTGGREEWSISEIPA